MMYFDPGTGQWYPTSSVPTGIGSQTALVDNANHALIDNANNVLVIGAAMAPRLTVTILTDGTRDGGTRRAECQQAAEMLQRVGEQLTNTQALTGAIVDRNGVASASYVYTPTAPA